MKQYNNRAIIFLLFSFCGLLFAIPVHAQTKQPQQILSISPIIIDVPLSPGKTYTKEITIQNMTDNPLPLQANLNDFQTTGEEGGYVFEETHTNPLLSWINISNTDLILNPKEIKKIQMTIKTPKEIPLGGYYGMLFFQPVLQDNTETITHIVPKVGVLLIASIGVPDLSAKKAEIPTFSIGFFQKNNQIPFLLRVKNVSLHFFTAKPILKITPVIRFTNTDLRPIYLEEKLLFQDKIRRWEQTITLPNNTPNIYKAHLILSTGNGEDITQDTYFVLLPGINSIGIIILVLLFLLGIIWKKRVIRAIKILIGKKS